jgi:hypothetical protein
MKKPPRRWINMSKVFWNKPEEKLPAVGQDVLAINKEENIVEEGFYSEVDKDNHSTGRCTNKLWCDFSFVVDGWITRPEFSDAPSNEPCVSSYSHGEGL